jgi:hypothetical protein
VVTIITLLAPVLFAALFAAFFASALFPVPLRHYVVAVPIVVNEIYGTATGVVLVAMLPPVGLMFGWHPEVNRLLGHRRRRGWGYRNQRG